jgi:hypothetical protein
MANKKPRKRAERKPRPSIGNLDHTDAVWKGLIIGDDERELVDPEEILKQHGYFREAPLEQLLLRLIDAAGWKDATERELRLRKSIAAITGKRMTKRPNYEEYYLLLNIARDFFKAYFDSGRNDPELKPIIAAVLAEQKEKIKYGSIQSQIDDLARKFNRQRDLLLARATTTLDWDPLDRDNRIRRVAEELAELGVPIATGYSAPVSKE